MLDQKLSIKLRRVIISLLIYVPIVWGLLELFSYYLDKIHADSAFIEVSLAMAFFGLVAVVIRSWFIDQPGKKLSRLEFALLGSNLVLCLVLFQFLFSNGTKDWNKGILITRADPQIRVAMLGVTRVSGEMLPESIMDAVQKTVMTGISHISGFKVIDASYVNLQPGKGLQQLSDPGFKKHLDLDYVVSITLLPKAREDDFRMLVNLLDINNLKIEWSGQYDANYASFFSTVEKITREMANNFSRRTKYVPLEMNGHATKSFLKGIHNYRKYKLENRYLASRFFQEAFLLDTTNILPLIYRAVNDLNLIFYGYVPQPDRVKGIRTIVQEGRRQGIAEAYTAQALHDLFFSYDWAKAEENLRRSMEMAPYDYVNYFELGIIQGMQGKWDRSINTFYKYKNDDPLNELYRLGLSISYFRQGIIDSAYHFYSQYHQVKDSDEPETIRFPLILDYYLGDKSAGEIKCDITHGDLVCAWLAGMNRTPVEILEEHIGNIPAKPGFHAVPEEMVKAAYYSGAGDYDSSMKFLKLAMENRSPFMIFLKMGMFPWLEGEEGGKQMLQEMGLAS